MTGSKQNGSDALADAARFCERRLTFHGFRVIARVWESERAFDLALAPTAQNARNVVRCVERIEPGDYRALRTMLAQGDFDRAALVYTGEDQPHLSNEIETCHLSRIDEFAASFSRESAP